MDTELTAIIVALISGIGNLIQWIRAKRKKWQGSLKIIGL